MLHVCTFQGCWLDVKECTNKDHKQKWPPEGVRGGSAERGYGTAWRKLRRTVLQRDRHTCQLCGDKGNEVDHIIPRAESGLDTLENLRTLCPPCHRTKTAADAAAGRKRR